MIEAVYIVSLLLAAAYLFVLLPPVWRFRRLPAQKLLPPLPLSVSIIVPARNEEMHILQCLAALQRQTCGAEIIVVNDHSADHTAALAASVPGVRVLDLEPGKAGKKAALEKGIAAAGGTLILTTDADCTPPPLWCASLSAALQGQTELCIGPILLQGGKSWLTAMQNIESIAVQSVSAGMLSQGVAFTASGASLGYYRHVPAAAGGYAQDQTPSGDDVLLLLRTHRRNPASVVWLHNPEAIVPAAAAATLPEFISQRIRWASKYGSYTSRPVRMLGLSLAAAAVWPWLLALAALYVPDFFVPLAGFLALKFAGDFLLLSLSQSFFRKPDLLRWFAVVWPLYQLLTPVIAAGALRKKFSWKERTYTT
ncbi:MAG: glycosyltransferase [Bacteroidetes bacterium]|nr:glycosyltransferase [Bacteroidota bacterium]